MTEISSTRANIKRNINTLASTGLEIINRNYKNLIQQYKNENRDKVLGGRVIDVRISIACDEFLTRRKCLR